jgi:hypothetical protein
VYIYYLTRLFDFCQNTTTVNIQKPETFDFRTKWHCFQNKVLRRAEKNAPDCEWMVSSFQMVNGLVLKRHLNTGPFDIFSWSEYQTSPVFRFNVVKLINGFTGYIEMIKNMEIWAYEDQTSICLLFESRLYWK